MAIPITTVNDLFNALEHYAQEKGLATQMNVLKKLADASLSSYTGTVGDINLVSDLTPDVVPTFRNPGAYHQPQDNAGVTQQPAPGVFTA